MTLHLSRVAKDLALQVSDRQITWSGRPFDELSNKNILYWARDALVSIGYTGIAYLEDTPTDQWLVEKLSGWPYERRRRPDMLMIGGVLNWWRNIELTLHLFQSELRRAFSQARASERQFHFELAIVGWRLKWKRKRQFVSSPFVARVIKAAGSPSVRVVMPGRRWYLGGKMMTGQTPEYLTPEEYQHWRHRLVIEHSDPQVRADHAERVFTEAIRSVSARWASVGPHCMSILLPPPGVGWVRVRYIPSESLDGHPLADYPVAYSPWIVGPRHILAPSVMRGTGWNIPLGQFSVVLEGPLLISPADREISWHSQTRPKPPR
jgi:hypothetical protein